MCSPDITHPWAAPLPPDEGLHNAKRGFVAGLNRRSFRVLQGTHPLHNDAAEIRALVTRRRTDLMRRSDQASYVAAVIIFKVG